MSDTVSITQGLNKRLGTAGGYVICKIRITKVEEMMNESGRTIDERNALALELAKLYSWQARNLRAQVAENRK